MSLNAIVPWQYTVVSELIPESLYISKEISPLFCVNSPICSGICSPKNVKILTQTIFFITISV